MCRGAEPVVSRDRETGTMIVWRPTTWTAPHAPDLSRRPDRLRSRRDRAAAGEPGDARSADARRGASLPVRIPARPSRRRTDALAVVPAAAFRDPAAAVGARRAQLREGVA